MTLKGDGILKRNWLVVSKIAWGSWLILMCAVASPKICTLMDSFCPNHIKFYMKKYKKVLSHDTMNDPKNS